MTRVELEAGARRVYELQRKAELRRKNRQGAVPTWDQLGNDDRRRLVAAHRALLRTYDKGRRFPRETPIRQTDELG